MSDRKDKKQILKELAAGQLLSHRGRNFVMTIAVLLTALLLSFVFTAGFSFIVTMKESSEAAPGPGEDGAVIGTFSHYEQIKQMENVEWADWVQICSSSSLKNDIFAGIQAELLAPDEGFFLHNRITPVTGAYPKQKNEIMISDTLAQHLGVGETGGELRLQVMITVDDGTKKEASIPMRICGIYANPIRNLSSVYEEIYTTPDFITAQNPRLKEGQDYIYIKLNDLNPFAMKSDVYQKLEEIRQEAGANYVETKHYNNFYYSFVAAIPIFLLVFLIILSGYFLIYNVFSISITMDVKWFGMMKTIGATQKQITYIYRRQIFMLALFGIVTGTVAGYLLGLLMAPRILAMTSFAMYFKGANIVTVMVFTIVFTWVTVRIGSSRVIKKAASLSPVDAAKFVPHRRKKAVTILSFSLSGIIFIAVGNAVFGYRTDEMIERYNQGECKIWHYADQMALDDKYQPISLEFYESIKSLPFVDDIDVIYKARTMPDVLNANGMELYEGFSARVKQNDAIRREADAIAGILGDTEILKLTDDGDIKLEICGIPAGRLEKELSYFHVREGEIDPVLFSEGDYILYQSPCTAATSAKLKDKDKIHAGDVFTIDFYDDELKGYVSKKIEVMAVIASDDPYSVANISNSNIIMSDDMFKAIYPDYETHIAMMEILSQRSFDKQEMEQIKGIVQEQHNLQIKIKSRYDDYIYFTKEKQSVLIIGLFFSAVLGVIGISNLVNTLIMDVVFREKQISMLQSIGMTEKQLARMLFTDSLKLSGIAMGLILAGGRFAASVLASSTSFTGFNLNLFFLESIGIVIFVVAVAGILAMGLTRWLNKRSIVERLNRS